MAVENPLPAPPPSLPYADVRPPALSRGIFLALYALLFGRFWLNLGPADWLGAAAASAFGATVFYYGDRGKLWRKASGAAFTLAMLACLYRSGMPTGTALSFELLVSLGLILTLGVLSIYLGLIAAEADRTLALCLMALSGAGMLGLALRMKLPAEELRSFAASEGIWRWGGLGFFYAGFRIFFPAKIKVVVEKRVINWNTHQRTD